MYFKYKIGYMTSSCVSIQQTVCSCDDYYSIKSISVVNLLASLSGRRKPNAVCFLHVHEAIRLLGYCIQGSSSGSSTDQRTSMQAYISHLVRGSELFGDQQPDRLLHVACCDWHVRNEILMIRRLASCRLIDLTSQLPDDFNVCNNAGESGFV